MLTITSVICEPYSSACALINCTPTRLNVYNAVEIPLLDGFIGKRDLRADLAKVKAIVDWPISKNHNLRKWLGLANYLY